MPPLLSSSPAGTDEDVAGVLDEPSTGILVGNGAPGAWPRPGARTTLGHWFDPGHRFGIHGSYAAVWRDTWRFAEESQGDPVLARPFLNVEPGSEGQDAELLAFEELWELEGNGPRTESRYVPSRQKSNSSILPASKIIGSPSSTSRPAIWISPSRPAWNDEVESVMPPSATRLAA